MRITVQKGAGYSVVPSVQTEAPSPTFFQKAKLRCPFLLEACWEGGTRLPSIHLGPSHDSHMAWA